MSCLDLAGTHLAIGKMNKKNPNKWVCKMHSPEPSLHCPHSLLSSLLLTLRLWPFASSLHLCLPHFQFWHLSLFLPGSSSGFESVSMDCQVRTDYLIFWIPWLGPRVLSYKLSPWIASERFMSLGPILSQKDPKLDIGFQLRLKPQISVIAFPPCANQLCFFSKQILNILPLSSNYFTLGLSAAVFLKADIY